jgi:hypothetical protein
VFVNTVRRRVRDHESREGVAVLLDFGVQVVDVDVTVFLTRNNDNLHPGQDCGCRVCTVGARRNDARDAVVVTPRKVVAANREKAGKLTLDPALG